MKLSELPALCEPFFDGKFAGVITQPNGKHYAVFLLDAKPEKRLNWAAAKNWAANVGGQLPSRAIAMLLFSVFQRSLPPGWLWTDEQYGSSFAWIYCFRYGFTCYNRSSEGGALAVRLIELEV